MNYKGTSASVLGKKLFLRIASFVFPVIVLATILIEPASAKTTFVIRDGSNVTVYTGDETSPADILNEVGVEITGADQVHTFENDGVNEIQILREQRICVYNGNQLITVISYGETVQEILERLNIDLSGDALVSVALNSQTYNGMIIHVDRDVVRNESYSSIIPFETCVVEDDSLPAGHEVVLTEGKNGEEVITAEVHYFNNEVVSKTVISTQTTIIPVNQIVAIGTRESDALPVIEHNNNGGTIQLPTGELLTYSEKISVMATAYTCEGWNFEGITATGTVARVGEIAVDPDVIPLGSRVFIQTSDGSIIYGLATAEDTGELIVGNRIDLYMDTIAECFQFGYRPCDVYILG